ncbi:MotA/TolQ/ExbB proton channel family protein [Nitrosococcus oceani]|uniref:MotA/TolQ/ExbB proton channel family protein n=1 Tax=Nitrosococcus oceani TaxID=1229 RepID=UPI000560F028|nr:MotA/TolQ/ExbB proton channel family protein [Nitrosococcus oceani]
MTRWSTFLFVTATTLTAHAAEPTDLKALVEEVQSQSVLESKTLAAREQRFLQAREHQAAVVQKLRQTLAAERQRGEELKQRYKKNETTITAQTETLHAQMGTLGELFGVARQTAKEMQGLLEASLISSQYPGRAKLPTRLAESKANPTAKELENLWHLLLQEMLESSRVVHFQAPVITPDGAESRREVVRLGAFNVISDGQYLRYLPDSDRLVVLGKQPPLRLQDLAQELQQAESGMHPVALDPSRGAILSLMIQTPTIAERIQQGGVIGYIILGLGLVALILVGERLLILFFVRCKIRRQQQKDTPSQDNPLGRLRQVEQSHPHLEAEALGLKLDHAILRERARLRRFLPTLAVFASIAPLLGLLGTVSGMIETFQSITLFGTGDPKLMSSGISLALITTELGLIVAIPILLLYSWLSGFSRRLIFILDEESAALTAQREEQRHALAA